MVGSGPFLVLAMRVSSSLTPEHQYIHEREEVLFDGTREEVARICGGGERACPCIRITDMHEAFIVGVGYVGPRGGHKYDYLPTPGFRGVFLPIFLVFEKVIDRCTIFTCRASLLAPLLTFSPARSSTASRERPPISEHISAHGPPYTSAPASRLTQNKTG